MSRLDYITISIVGVCIIAIVLLLVKTNDLLNANEGDNRDALERHLEEMGLEDTADVSDAKNLAEEDKEKKEDPSESVPAKEGGDEIKYDEKIDPPAEEYEPEPKKETKTTTKPSPPQPAPTRTKGAYAVLGGAFKQKLNADKLVKQLANAGFKNATVEISPGGAYARVIVDRFDDKSAADKLAEQLKSKGFESFVKGK